MAEMEGKTVRSAKDAKGAEESRVPNVDFFASFADGPFFPDTAKGSTH